MVITVNNPKEYADLAQMLLNKYIAYYGQGILCCDCTSKLSSGIAASQNLAAVAGTWEELITTIGKPLITTVYAYNAGNSSGATTINMFIPDAAGKNVFLRRGGYPMIAQEIPSRIDAQYEHLGNGWFRLLLAGDVFQFGEVLELTYYKVVKIKTG